MEPLGLHVECPEAFFPPGTFRSSDLIGAPTVSKYSGNTMSRTSTSSFWVAAQELEFKLPYYGYIYIVIILFWNYGNLIQVP